MDLLAYIHTLTLQECIEDINYSKESHKVTICLRHKASPVNLNVVT